YHILTSFLYHSSYIILKSLRVAYRKFMHLLFFVIFFLIHFEKSHSSAPLESDLTVERLRSTLPVLQQSWELSSLTPQKNAEDEAYSRVSSFYSSKKGVSLNSNSYKYVYIEVTFKKDAYSDSIFKRRSYSKNSTFLSFLEGHSVTKLLPDSSVDFSVLSKLSSLSPEVVPCETLSFFEYFPESEESYTISFIR
ncbi:MAG: hypothetical protein K2Q34_07545, partial [Alphaproteobacteria bacterium]|nr:hypothetical protein [Alphaproteobacteria bacterium]